jgi:hypothetical protein
MWGLNLLSAALNKSLILNLGLEVENRQKDAYFLPQDNCILYNIERLAYLIKRIRCSINRA